MSVQEQQNAHFRSIWIIDWGTFQCKVHPAKIRYDYQRHNSSAMQFCKSWCFVLLTSLAWLTEDERAFFVDSAAFPALCFNSWKSRVISTLSSPRYFESIETLPGGFLSGSSRRLWCLRPAWLTVLHGLALPQFLCNLLNWRRPEHGWMMGFGNRSHTLRPLIDDWELSFW